MDTISVIIPVYKVESYLEKCIKSVLQQTYSELEILLIEDGSPDNCGRICDIWAKRDCRIKVIHQDNKGAAAARNNALDLCTGDYIIFVDSDDYISTDLCKFLMSKFTDDVDIVECSYLITEDDLSKFDDILDNDKSVTKYSSEEAMKEHLQEHYFQQIIWNKMYRRSVIGKIRFVENKTIDDEFWTYKVIGNARNLVHSDKHLYAYRQQKDSIMHTISSIKRIQTFEALSQKHEYICNHYPNLRQLSLENLWFAGMYYMQLLMRDVNKSDIEDLRIIVEVVKKYPFANFKGIKSSHIIWLFLAKLNFTLTCKLRNMLKIGM